MYLVGGGKHDASWRGGPSRRSVSLARRRSVKWLGRPHKAAAPHKRPAVRRGRRSSRMSSRAGLAHLAAPPPHCGAARVATRYLIGAPGRPELQLVGVALRHREKARGRAAGTGTGTGTGERQRGCSFRAKWIGSISFVGDTHMARRRPACVRASVPPCESDQRSEARDAPITIDHNMIGRRNDS